MTPHYAIAAVRARPDGGPMRPWHAADLPDANFHEQAGDVAASLCGVPMLRVFPLEWDEDRAAHGCPACRSRARRPS